MVKNVHSLKWTNKAKADIKNIYNYIKDRDKSSTSALYVISSIRNKAKETIYFPFKSPAEPTFNEKEIRFAVLWSYKIIFEIKVDHILILRVFHSSQDPSNLIK